MNESLGLVDSVLFHLSWMAWTYQTALFFLIIFGSILLMGVLEKIYPSRGPRRGVLGLITTRGDRLFLSYLGSAYISLLWLFFFGPPLTMALLVIGVYVFIVFKFV